MIRNRNARRLRRTRIKQWAAYTKKARRGTLTKKDKQPPSTDHVIVAPARHDSLPFRAGWKAMRAAKQRGAR
jgi:hypothetical protein